MTEVTVRDWSSLEHDWQRLYAASGRATPFQSWHWVYNYFHYGMAEGEALLLSFSEGGECIGIAPLILRQRKRGLKRLLLLGGDYNDILTKPGSEQTVLSALEQWLGQNTSKWDVADFRSLRQDSVLLQRDFENIDASRSKHQTYPVTHLPGSWTTYVASLGNSFRSHLRYYPNKLSREFGDISIRRATRDTLHEDLETMFRLHQMRWESKGMPGVFSSDAVRDFHRAFAVGVMDDGELDLFTYEVAGRAAASFYGFHKGEDIVYYLGGFDPEFAKFGPLKLLIAAVMQDSIESGRTVFDFIKGEEQYKQDWRAQGRSTYRLVLGSGGVRPRIVMAGLEYEPKVKALKKRLFRRG